MADLIIVTKCEGCCREINVTVDRDDYRDWESGEKDIQEAMGYLDRRERELLSSKTCSDCRNSWYSED